MEPNALHTHASSTKLKAGENKCNYTPVRLPWRYLVTFLPPPQKKASGGVQKCNIGPGRSIVTFYRPPPPPSRDPEILPGGGLLHLGSPPKNVSYIFEVPPLESSVTGWGLYNYINRSFVESSWAGLHCLATHRVGRVDHDSRCRTRAGHFR